MVPQYVYSLTVDGGTGTAVFFWPNVCRKYIRDSYTLDGKLCLPPPERLKLKRLKPNPKPGYPSIEADIDVEKFLAAP